MAILSATIGCLSTPPFSLVPLVYLYLIPVFIVLHNGAISTRQKILFILFHSWLIGISNHHWLYYAIHEFGGIDKPLAVLLTCAVSAVTNLEYVFAGLAAIFTLRRYPATSLAVYGIVHVVCFYFPALKLFPWTTGCVQILSPIIAPAYYVLGQAGMMGVVLFLNTVLYYAWRLYCSGIKNYRIFLARDLGACILFVALCIGFKCYLDHHKTDMQSQKIRFLVVQANVMNFMKQQAKVGHYPTIRKTIKIYIRKTNQALKNLAIPPSKESPVVVIWPESAYPLSFPTPISWKSRRMNPYLSNWMNQHEFVHFIFGATSHNAVWFNNHQVKGIYKKIHLLPFGEYMPYKKHMPAWVLKLWAQNRNPTPGTEWAAWPLTDTLTLVPTICYDALFPQASHFAIQNHAHLFLNLTKDGWFVVRRAQELHLMMARIRSASTGIPMLRSTNTGITAWINSNGQIEEQLPINQMKTLSLEKQFPRSQTPRYWFWIQNLISWLFLIVWFWRCRNWHQHALTGSV